MERFFRRVNNRNRENQYERRKPKGITRASTLGGGLERKGVVGKRSRRLFSAKQILKQCYQYLNPTVVFKHRCSTQNLEHASNQQLVSEFLINPFSEVDALFQKLQIQPPQLGAAYTTGLTVGNQIEQIYKYEGGTYTYSFTNTGNQTAYLEFRVYGLAVKAVGHGISRGSSPLNAWAYDDANTNTGDNWPLETGITINGNNIQNGVATLSALTVAQQSQGRDSSYANAYSFMDSMKRPKKCSPMLHQGFDLESKKTIILRPGETYHHVVIAPKFWNAGKRAVVGDNTEIERYTKILWVMQRGEFVTDTSTNTPAIAPGSTQITMTTAIKHVIRSPAITKSNYCIESTSTAGTRGGFDDIATANEATFNELTNAEQLFNEIGI